jgi:hypothetical protein
MIVMKIVMREGVRLLPIVELSKCKYQNVSFDVLCYNAFADVIRANDHWYYDCDKIRSIRVLDKDNWSNIRAILTINTLTDFFVIFDDSAVLLRKRNVNKVYGAVKISSDDIKRSGYTLDDCILIDGMSIDHTNAVRLSDRLKDSLTT